ncbi:MAG TPA: transporter [Thermoanaerobaculia bacterium]
MKRAVVAVLYVFLLVPAAQAQITIQHGNTLSELISNLYGGDGIQLKDTGHEAHFGQSQDFQNFSATLQSVLQSRPVFPIPSAVGLVSYRFNEETGTYERIQGSLGPLIADRGATTGRGTLTFSTTYTFSDFDQVNGRDAIDVVLRHCLTDDCVTNVQSPYLADTIHVSTRFRMKSQAVALSTVYGLSDTMDVGLVIPYIRNDLTIRTDARIVPGPQSTPPGPHEFDLLVETPGQMGTATAIGIGDIVARAKMRILPRRSFDAAILADVSLPTGDKDNFLGTGDVRVKASFVASRVVKRLIPHINIGYELNTGETKLSAFDYRIGSEFALRPSITVSGEILGVVRPGAGSLFRSDALQGQSLIGRSEIDGAIGAKWQVSPNRAVLFNVVTPLNSTGVRATNVITLGLQSSL